MKYYVGIDLGGTFIKAGVVDEEYHILAKSSVPSQVDGDDEGLADRIAQAATMAMEQLGLTIKDITSVGVGTPGAVDTVNGVVVYANNLGFRNTPLGKYLEDRLHTSVYLENDANVAAYGEVLAGAAAGYKDVVVVTLGTGVGGGIIIDGKIYRGFNQFGGELGHMVVQYGGRQCTCGRKGCIEAYASAMESIPRTLAENAGLDPIDILIAMRKQHKGGNIYAGLNPYTGKVEDMKALNVIEPYRIGKQAINSATDAAVMILRIDDVIASKASPMPQVGEGGMPPGME